MESATLEDGRDTPSDSDSRPNYTRTDSELSAELVDAHMQGLSDTDGVLVESHTVKTLNEVPGSSVIAPSEASLDAQALEAAHGEDDFSLASGMSESTHQLSELESIGDASTQFGDIDSLPNISAAVSQVSLPQYEAVVQSLAVRQESVLHMSPTIPSEMVLTMPIPEGSRGISAGPDGYNDSDFVAVSDNGNDVISSGTATPRQLRMVASLSPRSTGTPPAEVIVPQIHEPIAEPYIFPSSTVSRETSQSTVETKSVAG